MNTLLKMPRASNKRQSIHTVDEAIYHAILKSLVDPSLLADANYHGYIEGLFIQSSYLSASRYIVERLNGSAGRLPINSIHQFLHYPDDGFLVNFRMMPESFWALVGLLEERGGPDYWCQNNDAGGRQGRPPHEQIAVALYTLGSPASNLERIRMKLNIGKGTVHTYVWRTINLLASLKSEFIQWPSSQARHQQQVDDEVFKDCVGYIDGTEIPLQYSPIKDREAYFSRKKIYGFNLQAVCNHHEQFIYAHMGATASTHDSTAFKGSLLYQQRSLMMADHEYILGDKAYQLDKHLITPYKLPIARQAECKAFNKAHSNERIYIEHTFGVLKARWSSLRSIPIRIRHDIEKDHLRVICWVMACLVLHNYLSLRGEPDGWLQDDLSNESTHAEGVGEENSAMKAAGDEQRDGLREKLQEKTNLIY